MQKILIAVVFLFMVACKHDKLQPVTVTADALVIDEGVNIAADGCGWHIITTNGIDYIPSTIDSAFAIDSLPVRVTFTSVDSAGCGFTANLKTHPLMNVQSMVLR